MSENRWLYRASLYELLAQSFLYTTPALAEALTSGEYAEALSELLALNGIAVPQSVDGNEYENKVEGKGESKDKSTVVKALLPYEGRASDEVLHELRRDYTRVFIGSKDPLVPPYGGAWYALERGLKPLLFVGKESLAVERFLRRCGVVQPEGTNEPLDHIASELEFLQYLCFLKAGAAAPPETADIDSGDYATFYHDHFRWFAQRFADNAIKECRAPFFIAAAQVLLALPEEAGE
ncbi:MAG: molecular chaperone TorD family protein [Coriobacteriales bacterium]|jgi:TorA maturation chaperone TorD|nr:molecular chaperone TorD family protein [Coriobacteriales bacterium]